MRSPGLGTCGLIIAVCLAIDSASADQCPVTHAQLARALKSSVAASGGPKNGGLENNEWAAVVSRNGLVCAIAFSGDSYSDQWPLGRAVAVEKANTANGVSLPNKAIATANLYMASQPGGSLFGAIATNPPDATSLYAGVAATYGTDRDPLVGHAVGGIVVFGGGLALFDSAGELVGGLGVSGDTACADHNVAWRIRQHLAMDNVPGGVSGSKDAIIYDIGPEGKSRSGYGHPVCGGAEPYIARQIGAGVLQENVAIERPK